MVTQIRNENRALALADFVFPPEGILRNNYAKTQRNPNAR